MTATTAFPRTQHWTTGRDGFRVTVMLYRSATDPCVTCGQRPARHSVWADGRGLHEGFKGGPVRFCDQHRPPKGPLPPLDYKRLVQGANVLSGGAPSAIIYERLAPYPEYACATCGDPALFEVTEHCPGCGDPGQQYTTSQMYVAGGTWDFKPPEAHHRLHPVREWWACAQHSPALAGAA